MRSPTDAYLSRDAASRALIDLIADVAWAERQHTAGAELQRARDEAIALLPKVGLGDRAATRRALELVSTARGDHAG